MGVRLVIASTLGFVALIATVANGCSVYGPDLLLPASEGGAPPESGPNDATSGGDHGLDSSFDSGSDSASDSGSDAGTGGDGAPEAGACPGTAGPPAVLVGNANVSFCVDSTEVTNSQYAQFLGANVPTTGQNPECAWNASYVPSTWPYASGHDNDPVRYVNWCDAVAYCMWAGKRLCGAIGGGPNLLGDYQNPSKSQWLFGCSHGGDGQHAYPYGNSYTPSACNDGKRDAGGPLPVATEPACVGGFPGLYDMSGNVFELEDSCALVDAGAANDMCVSRAGGWDSFNTATQPVLQCGFAFTVQRSFTAGDTGFRCCGP